MTSIRHLRQSGPAFALLSLAEAKAHCRIDHDDEDDLIVSLIEAATDHLDGRAGVLGRALATQVWRTETSGPVAGVIRLEPPPVRTVARVAYLSAGVEVELEPGTYRLAHDRMGAALSLTGSGAWPIADSREDAWRVTFEAGYPVDEIPGAIKHAVKLLVSHWHHNREAVATSSIEEVPLAVRMLIAPYRVWSL